MVALRRAVQAATSGVYLPLSSAMNSRHLPASIGFPLTPVPTSPVANSLQSSPGTDHRLPPMNGRDLSRFHLPLNHSSSPGFNPFQLWAVSAAAAATSVPGLTGKTPGSVDAAASAAALGVQATALDVSRVSKLTCSPTSTASFCTSSPERSPITPTSATDYRTCIADPCATGKSGLNQGLIIN